MARFPKSEARIAALAQIVLEGLERAKKDFPNPPVPISQLRAEVGEYGDALGATHAARTVFREQHRRKDDVLARMVGSLKACLRYAEIMAREHPEKLTQLGWGPPRPRTPRQTPGEVRDIRVVAEGDTWVELDWNAPLKGNVSAYVVQRRQQGGRWEDVATVVESEARVTEQPRGVELDYRVVAKNKAGTGRPSATVTLVL